MKILFAVSNENISAAIKKEYQDNYKGMLTTKNVYYFNAVIKELQNDKSYDVVIISEDLEPFANSNYDAVDKFLIGKLADIREESKKVDGTNLPIIFITTDRHTPGDNLLSKLYEIGIYNALFGENRSIHKVCELIAKPRNKDRAKSDYKIAGEAQVEENDDNVKESEIKNIIAHYKKLGKSEEKYVESFDNIASQYSDAQLKVIIRFLPLNVKAVLEEQSPKYQELMTFGQTFKKPTAVPKQLGKIKEQEKKLETKTDMLLEQLSDIKPDSQIIIPKTINSNIAQKATKQPLSKMLEAEEINEDAATLPGFEPVAEVEAPVEPVKRGRGRPRKEKPATEVVENAAPKKRGRPRKVQPVEEVVEETVATPNLFDLMKEEENEEVANEPVVETMLPGFDEIEDTTETETVESFEMPTMEPQNERPYANQFAKELAKTGSDYNYQNIENLVSKDRKIVSFVGTSKNGTSFIVNNVAQILASMEINVAILDMTKNKNSYYIYTKNEEELRQKALTSIEKLREGELDGISVSKNLTVYTANPNLNDKFEEADLILKTLIQNHSLVLIDCDFDTPLGYFDNSQEIYLVQSMDILTIQPLTAFLRDLKTKEILKQEKVRVIVNKSEKVRGLNEKVIVGGIAFYNDPSMSFMTELFNKDLVKTCVIPFDLQVYVKYLGTMVDCVLSVSGYPKQFIGHLKRLASMIYPLIPSQNSNMNKKGNTYVPPSFNNYQAPNFGNGFNNNNGFNNMNNNMMNNNMNNNF